MLFKNCPKCKRLMPYGKTYCDTCAKAVKAEREQRKAENIRRYNQRRNPKYKKFYNSNPWKNLSKARLEADKRCALCGKPATEVDHIIEIQTPEGWKRRLDWSNTRSLCTKCHNQKHNRFTSNRQRHSTIDGGG